MVSLQAGNSRMSSNAGIAIGPILFIIAILAILAAAIAAGSGSFTAGTASESNRTKSSALIQIGENLKIGMDRITMEGGIDTVNVGLNVQSTSANTSLFAPAGGGIAPPSVGMANNPSIDKWLFVSGPVSGLGTGTNASPDVVALLPVSQGVCAEVNNRVLGVAAAPGAVELSISKIADAADGNSATFSGLNWPTASTAPSWPSTATTGPNLVGVATGCVVASDVTVNTTTSPGPSTVNFFYQVIAVQ